MERVFLVGFGGFIGSALRYWVSGFVQQYNGNFTFPSGTLVVNILGCLLIGFLSELEETRGILSSETRAMVFIGMLGGFTTFSTFGNETFNYLRNQQPMIAILNVGANLLLGLGAVWVGHSLVNLIWR